MRRTCAVILLTLILCLHYSGQAVRASEIEVFDVVQGSVIKHIEGTPYVQQEMRNMVQTITGMVKDLKIEPTDGYLVKIPLEPPIMIKDPYLNILAEELILFISSDSEPKLLLFSDENQPYFVHFNYDFSFFLLNTI